MTKEMIRQIENDYWEEKADPIDMTEVFDLASKALEERPTAHFVRYINHNYSPFDNSPEYIMRCSNCGGALSEGAFYCPNCGAKMKGETNDR